MAVGDSFRLDSAIHKWHKVVSSYDYNMSRTSLQTTIIINAEAEKRINTLLYRHFALFFDAVLYIHRSTSHGH